MFCNAFFSAHVFTVCLSTSPMQCIYSGIMTSVLHHPAPYLKQARRRVGACSNLHIMFMLAVSLRGFSIPQSLQRLWVSIGFRRRIYQNQDHILNYTKVYEKRRFI